MTSESIADSVDKIKTQQPDVILLDLMLKNNENGLDGIRLIRKEDTDVPIIMITDFSSIETAIKAVKLGAFEYLPKSIRISELKLIIEKALELRYLKIRNESIEEEISSSFKEIVGESGVIKKLKEKIDLFASNDSTILVTGESGVGKELVTRQIHLNSDRKTEPFIVVNCAAIPPDLIESELFGHEKGAFTSADKKKNREV
ncbi:MAG: sigma 54-interacting transcriptional regulator [Ignavibacteria bacterium]